jgi:hypothetical protein
MGVKIMLQPFRKEKVTELTDDKGSTHTTEENFRDGQLNRPRRHYYENRYHSKEVTLDDISLIAKKLIQDPHKIETAIRLERSVKEPGQFYVIECYTVVEM